MGTLPIGAARPRESRAVCPGLRSGHASTNEIGAPSWDAYDRSGEAVGPRVNHYFDRPWAQAEDRQGKVVVIGLKGLDREAVANFLTGDTSRTGQEAVAR